jgi:hypothetical protein
MNYRFLGDILDSPAPLNGDEIRYFASNTLGLHAGLILGTAPFNFNIEFGVQRVSWSNTESATLYSFGYAVTAVW